MLGWHGAPTSALLPYSTGLGILDLHFGILDLFQCPVVTRCDCQWPFVAQVKDAKVGHLAFLASLAPLTRPRRCGRSRG